MTVITATNIVAVSSFVLNTFSAWIPWAASTANFSDPTPRRTYSWSRLWAAEGDVKSAVENNTDPVPVGEQEVRWPIIGDRPFDFSGQKELEPQETDEFVAEFMIDSDVEQSIGVFLD